MLATTTGISSCFRFEWNGKTLVVPSNSTSNDSEFIQLENLLHYEHSVTLKSESVEKSGDLIVSQEKVIFVSSTEESELIELQYPCIILHAVSQTPAPSIYLQYQSTPSQEDEDVDEIYLIPSQGIESVQAIYSALCKGAELHPDPNQEEFSDDDMFESHDFENVELSEQGQETLDRLNAMLQGQTDQLNGDEEEGQFEDAVEENDDKEADGDFLSR